MTEPLITSDDLAVYLNDPGIDTDRAEMLIGQSQQACETVVSPLTDAQAWVVTRVAGRAYTSILSPRAIAAAAAGGQFVGQAGGGVYLDRADIADLRRSGGGGGAFSIDLLPAGYVAPSSSHLGDDWDQIT